MRRKIPMNTTLMEDTYQLPTYAKLSLVLERGKGAYVWDQDGRKYLDFYGGHAVTLVGHCHPKILQAVKIQLDKLIFYSNAVYNEARAQAAQKLVGLSKDYRAVFLCNSGSEANETAIKLAKKYTGKDQIISFAGSFHGRTLASLSVTGDHKYKKGIGSLMPNVKFASFGDIKSVANLVSDDTAAIMVEPIQSLGGVNEAPVAFYQQLMKLAKQKGLVLIFDEIQTGLGRVGKMFFSELVGVTPDITTLAKGLAGGLPAGAVLVSGDIAKTVQINDQGSTFGGGPLVCSAISATLDIITKEGLIKNAQKSGKMIKNNLSKVKHVMSVRGEGLLLGIVLDIPAKVVQTRLLKKGVIAGTSSNTEVLRIMPPLTITSREINLFIKTLSQVLEEI